MPGLDIELPGALFQVIKLAGIVHPEAGGSHVVHKGGRIGTHRADALGKPVVWGGSGPVKLKVQLLPQEFLGNKLGVVAVAAAVKIAENHLFLVQRKEGEQLPAQADKEAMEC